MVKVCNYAEAFVPYLLTSHYCSLQYPSAADVVSCQNDNFCEYDSESGGCSASIDVLFSALHDAQIVSVALFPSERFYCRNSPMVLKMTRLENMNRNLRNAITFLMNTIAMVFGLR